ncbi:MAG: hypothetical protein ACYCQJ_02805 [Nitrososphaerales archaeon]
MLQFGNASKILNRLVPILCAIFVMILLLRGSFTDEVIGIEAATIVFTVWFVGRPFQPNHSRTMRQNHKLLIIVEYSSLALAFTSLLFTYDYIRPVVFFVLFIGFYSALLMEILSNTKPSMSSFTLKIFIAQFVFLESFGFLYPGFVAEDPYRDWLIALSIITKGGGLPNLTGSNVWYDFSPIAPLLYSMSAIVTQFNLRNMELIIGFIFVSLVVVFLGCLVNYLTSDVKTACVAMLLGVLIPYLSFFSTWPIPEMLALCFVCAGTVVLLRTKGSRSMIMMSLLSATVVFTHGGMAIIYMILMLVLYVATRHLSIFYNSLTLVVMFFTYGTYVVMGGVMPGISTIWVFLLQSMAPRSLSTPSTLVSGSNVIELVFPQYTWILLVALSMMATLGMLNKDMKYRKVEISLTVLGGVLLFLGIFVSGILHTQNTEFFRYVGLTGYPLICISASLELVSLSKFPFRRRIILFILLLLLIISAVTNVSVSPDFWQGVGQSHYATDNRLYVSTTTRELSSQTFLNSYDFSYYVESNYQLKFINITDTQPILAISGYPENGYTTNPVKGEPHIVLVSFRAIQLGFVNPDPSTDISIRNGDIVYANGGSQAAFFPN